MSECPRCGEKLTSRKWCECGWRVRENFQADPDYHRCAWVNKQTGERCTSFGSITPTTHEPAGAESGKGSKVHWYCPWHYECLLNPQMDGPEAYQSWCEMWANYNARKTLTKKYVCEGWNENDEYQIKGLACLINDEKSIDEVKKSHIVWRKAPQVMLEKAWDLKQNGWKPKGNIFSKENRLKGDEVINEHDFEMAKREMIRKFNESLAKDTQPDGR